MSFEEWDGLLWCEQQIYINGFHEEKILTREGEQSPVPSGSSAPSRGGSKKIDLTSADLSELGDSFTVRRAG